MTCCKDDCPNGASHGVSAYFDEHTPTQEYPVCTDHLQEAATIMADLAPAVNVRPLKQGELL